MFMCVSLPDRFWQGAKHGLPKNMVCATPILITSTKIDWTSILIDSKSASLNFNHFQSVSTDFRMFMLRLTEGKLIDNQKVRETAHGTIRMVPEYCSACVSRVVHSTKQAAEPYSDNLFNCTVLGQRDSLEKSFEAIVLLVGFPSRNPPTVRTFTAWSRTRNRTRTPPELFKPQTRERKFSPNFF